VGTSWFRKFAALSAASRWARATQRCSFRLNLK
jgi:hypothetical protein